MSETILATTKRATFWVNAQLGAGKDSRLKAMLYDFKMDCGAYEGSGGLLLAKTHKRSELLLLAAGTLHALKTLQICSSQIKKLIKNQLIVYLI